MWSSFKSLWSSKPYDKHASTRKKARMIAHYIKHDRFPSARPSARHRHSRRSTHLRWLDSSDSERKLNNAIHQPLDRSRRSRNDDRIRRLKKELASLDHKFSAASESEGNTAELQRIVGKLESKFIRARQELAAALASKAAKQNALYGQYGQYGQLPNMMPIMNAAMMQASYAAPGLAAMAPPTPAALNAAALGASAHALMTNPAATPEQIQLAQAQHAAAREKAAQEAADRGRRFFDLNATNDAQTAAAWNASKQHFSNIGTGAYGALAGPGNAVLAAANTGKGWFARMGQNLGLTS